MKSSRSLRMNFIEQSLYFCCHANPFFVSPFHQYVENWATLTRLMAKFRKHEFRQESIKVFNKTPIIYKSDIPFSEKNLVLMSEGVFEIPGDKFLLGYLPKDMSSQKTTIRVLKPLF